MHLDRRSLLASLCWIAASPVLAADAPTELETYERESGGRIGVYAENLAKVYRFVFQRLRNREEAEGLTSQVFLKVLRYLDPERSAQSAPRMSCTRSLASPKSMALFSRKKSGFCTPA